MGRPESPPAELDVRRLEVEGIDGLRATIRGAPCDLTQMSAGTLRARFVRSGDESRNVVWQVASKALRVRGVVPDGWVSAVVVLRTPAPALYGEYLAAPGSLIVYGSGAEYDAAAPAGFTWASLHLRTEEFDSLVRPIAGAGVHLPGRRGRMVPLSPAARAHFLDLGRRSEWAEGDPAGPEGAARLVGSWIRALGVALADRPGNEEAQVTPAVGARIFARAEEYLRAHLAETIYLRDVCAACGTHQRSLQSAFRTRLGLTPFEYLRTLRLHQVRRALVERSGDPTASVAEEARRWGLLHPGRLSVDYRAHFGESPSVTLRAPRPAVRSAQPPEHVTSGRGSARA